MRNVVDVGASLRSVRWPGAQGVAWGVWGILAWGCAHAEPAPPTKAAEGSAAAVAPAEPGPARQRWLATVSTIGVAGASASAGFGASVPLFEALDYALRVPHTIEDVSTSTHFMSPVPLGRMQVGALRSKPVSVVIAVDFLFWFAHGVKSPAQRRAELDEGMRLLDTLSVPVFVGDLPDVHGASARMIGPAQIPSVALLAEFNAAIARWAEARPHVHVVPMAGWMAALRGGEPIALGDAMVTVDPAQVLQPDRLHPSTRGQALLSILVLAEVARTVGGSAPDDVVDDAEQLTAVLARSPNPSGADPVPAEAVPP